MEINTSQHNSFDLFDIIDDIDSDIKHESDSDIPFEIDPPMDSSSAQGIKLPIRKASLKFYERENINNISHISSSPPSSGIKLPIRTSVIRPYQRENAIISPLTIKNKIPTINFQDMISSIHKTIHSTAFS